MSIKDALSANYVHCRLCSTQWLVSEEDPESTGSEAFQHVRHVHPQADPYGVLAVGPTPEETK